MGLGGKACCSHAPAPQQLLQQPPDPTFPGLPCTPTLHLGSRNPARPLGCCLCAVSSHSHVIVLTRLGAGRHC